MTGATFDRVPDSRRGSVPPRRTLAEAPSLQALAHPTRLALIEQIGLAGSLTATQASARVGESPTACAYHLRTLARLGFLEEAGGGRGPERPWRLAQAGISIEDGDDPAVAKAADALSKVLTERFINRIRGFEVARSRFPSEVQAVTGVFQSVVFATPEELSALRAQILALMSQYIERIDPELRPPDSRAFELVLFTHVLDVTGQGEGDAQAAQNS